MKSTLLFFVISFSFAASAGSLRLGDKNDQGVVEFKAQSFELTTDGDLLVSGWFMPARPALARHAGSAQAEMVATVRITSSALNRIGVDGLSLGRAVTKTASGRLICPYTKKSDIKFQEVPVCDYVSYAE